MAFLGQFRGDLRSEWEAKNPVIHDREFILVKEDPDGPWTGYKIGDGGKRFNELDYASNISLLQILGNSEVAAVSQKVTTSVSKDLARAISIKWWNKGSDLPYNGYINENGSLVSLSGIFSTDFIEVSPGVDIQVVNAFIVDKAVIAIYSTSKTFTRYLKDMDDNGNVTFSLNEGEKYIRFSSMSTTEGVGVRFININIVGINEQISDIEDKIISINEQVSNIKDSIAIFMTPDNTSSGYINKLGKLVSGNVGRYSSKISIKKGANVIIEKPFIQENAATCTFDMQGTLIRSFNSDNTEINPDYLKFQVIENEAYFISSFKSTLVSNSILCSIDNYVDNTTNSGSEYKSVPVIKGAYIGTGGGVISLSSFCYNDYTYLPKGIPFKVINGLMDNASLAIYNKDKEVVRVIKSGDVAGLSEVVFSLQENEEYFRTSLPISKLDSDFISIFFAETIEKIDLLKSIDSINEQDVEPSKDFINIVSAFDNLICVGDSLTYSQVYTSTTGSRQAYVSYPKALARLCGNEQTTLARSGATAKQCWDEFGSQIVQKKNSLAIIYLGTNAGISDTLSTDVVGDDPDAWADNNLGCYCRIVQKLQSLGTKVLLLKIWASSGTGDSSLANTKNAITHIGERFNCAVMDVPLNRELKYHYYPDLSGSNGVHYNDLGYAWFASSLIQKIGELDESQMKLLIPS